MIDKIIKYIEQYDSLYFFAFAVSIIIVGLIVLIAAVIISVIAERLKKPFPSGNFAVFIYLWLGIVSTCYLSWLGLSGYFNLNPPYSKLKQSYAAEKIDGAKIALEKEQLKLSNPKSISIQELEITLSNIISLSTQLADTATQQKEEISLLQQSVAVEQRKAVEAQRLANSIQSLSKDQIEAVQFLITKDASESSRSSFVWGLVISFPVGFLASFLASFLYGRYSKEVELIKNKVTSVYSS